MARRPTLRGRRHGPLWRAGRGLPAPRFCPCSESARRASGRPAETLGSPPGPELPRALRCRLAG
eukprot:4894600-Alexandrium_andersonii.AAC.1